MANAHMRRTVPDFFLSWISTFNITISFHHARDIRPYNGTHVTYVLPDFIIEVAISRFDIIDWYHNEREK